MKYFLDTEFIEGTQKKWLGQTKPTIDLISIGIVAEDGREYYAISKDFNIKEAWHRWQQRTGCGDYNNINPKYYWIRDNVLKPIFIELRAKEVEEYNIAQRRNVVLDFPTYSFCFREFKRLLNKYGKTNKQIAKEIYDFISETTYETEGFEASLNENLNPQFYGYYSDYDWVVFCWLFGRMIDLPKGFPMYCIDLKQTLDEKIKKSWKDVEMSTWGHNGIENITKLPNYPKQTNEHNALADARWNRQLYNFLNTL